jgi:methionine biosynthesis protein MetW
MMRPDLDVVAAMVPRGARVLDLGCGDGALLDELIHRRGCVGQGVEVSSEAFHACMARGIPVMEADIDRGLPDFADDAYDVVVLSQTLQATRRPAVVLEEMMRVGSTGIVSFPNFGHWLLRARLLVRGRMPRSRALPHRWHETPNIHLCTLGDFEDLVARMGLGIAERRLLDVNWAPSDRGRRRPNLLAAGVVYRLEG